MRTLLILLFILVSGAAINVSAQIGVSPGSYGHPVDHGTGDVVRVTPDNMHQTLGPGGGATLSPDEMRAAFDSGIGGGGGGGGDGVNWNLMYFYMWLFGFISMMTAMM